MSKKNVYIQTIEEYVSHKHSIPQYQRKAMYSDQKKAYLVASALSGISLGCITLTSKGEILDGQQRTTTFNEVLNDSFVLLSKMFKNIPEEFKDIIPEDLFGLPFSMWKNGYKKAFLNTEIIISEITDTVKYNRLQYWMMNGNMMILNPEEKRKAITSDGVITDYKKKIATWPIWSSIFAKGSIQRSKVEEFASELLMMVITSKAGDKKKKLSDFIIKNNNSKSDIVINSYDELKKITDVVNSIMPERVSRNTLYKGTHYYTLCQVIMNMYNNGMEIKNIDKARNELHEFLTDLVDKECEDEEIDIYKMNSRQGSDSLQSRSARSGIITNRLMKHFKNV